MDTVAVVLASLGFIVSVLSFIESRRSRRAAQASAESAAITADLDGQRRHEELAPRARAEVTELRSRGGISEHGIRLVSDGPLDYEAVNVELLPAANGERLPLRQIESVATNYVGEPEVPIPAGPLRNGESLAIVFHPEFDEDARPLGGDVRLRVVFKAGGAEWTKHFDIHVPWPPRVY